MGKFQAYQIEGLCEQHAVAQVKETPIGVEEIRAGLENELLRFSAQLAGVDRIRLAVGADVMPRGRVKEVPAVGEEGHPSVGGLAFRAIELRDRIRDAARSGDAVDRVESARSEEDRSEERRVGKE